MVIKKIESNAWEEAVELVWKVFSQYEAPEYSSEGINTFKKFIFDEKCINMLEMFGAYIEDSLVGVIATRNLGSHISLFFVDGAYHRRGIGKLLFAQVIQNFSGDKITVNSSPYAVEVYKHLGFTPDSGEKLSDDGIRYTPMTYRL